MIPINSDSFEPFSENFIDGAMNILGNCALPNHLGNDDYAKLGKEALWLQLNGIKNIQPFDNWVPPAKVRDTVKREREIR